MCILARGLGGRTLSSSCVSARHPHLPITHLQTQNSTPCALTPLLCGRAQTPTPLLPLPSPRPPLPPKVLSGRTQWPREVYTPPHPHPPRRDVMWGRALRLFTGVGGGEAAELLELGQSLTLWAVGPATDSAAPPLPTPARLTRPWKHRLAALRWGAPQYPSLSFPAHSTSGPPLTLERHRELSQGGLGKFPGPLCQEVPGAPARQPPPRGRCPGALPHGAGRRRLLPEP